MIVAEASARSSAGRTASRAVAPTRAPRGDPRRGGPRCRRRNRSRADSCPNRRRRRPPGAGRDRRSGKRRLTPIRERRRPVGRIRGPVSPWWSPETFVLHRPVRSPPARAVRHSARRRAARPRVRRRPLPSLLRRAAARPGIGRRGACTSSSGSDLLPASRAAHAAACAASSDPSTSTTITDASDTAMPWPPVRLPCAAMRVTRVRRTGVTAERRPHRDPWVGRVGRVLGPRVRTFTRPGCLRPCSLAVATGTRADPSTHTTAFFPVSGNPRAGGWCFETTPPTLGIGPHHPNCDARR